MQSSWPSAVMMGKMADVMTEMTGEIKDGKYSSAPEARQASIRRSALRWAAAAHPVAVRPVMRRDA